MKPKEEHLQEIIDTLENDYKNGLPMSAIRVENISNPNNVFDIIANTTNDELVKDYGSATAFFEKLSKSTAKKIRIYPLKVNGTCATKNGRKITWKRSTKIEPLEMSFASNENTQMTTEGKPVETQNHPVYYPPALNGGLSGSDFYKIYDHERLQRENSDLKAKNELLEKENKRLEREVLTGEMVGQKEVEKAQAKAEMVKAGQGYLPVVLEAIRSLRPQPAATGLAGTFSPVKERFLKADDDLLLELEQIGIRYDNQNFIDELNVLLTKYPLQNGQ